jgi:hypothetical protein
MICCDRLAALCKGRAGEQEEPKQRDRQAGGNAEDANSRIPFHRYSFAPAQVAMSFSCGE